MSSTPASEAVGPVPEARAYMHRKCSTDTVVSGQAFETVSNPMSSMTRTWCTHCQAHDSITEYAWSDTGESLADYYTRHSAGATNLQRFLVSKKFMVFHWVLGFILASIGAWFLFANAQPGMRFLFTPLTGLIGVFIATACFVECFANPITRKVCGVKDTRVLR